jgi:malate dehydrogenase (oxaloacetate-decarboxylating)(NADP+)
VPDSVLRAYGLDSLKFGDEYIIPKPLDPRVLLWESVAVAEGRHGNRRGPQADRPGRIPRAAGVPPGQGRAGALLHHAQGPAGARQKKRVVFAEGEEPKIIRAAAQVRMKASPIPSWWAARRSSARRSSSWGWIAARVVNPADLTAHRRLRQAYYELRKRKGVTLAEARPLLRDPTSLAR